MSQQTGKILEKAPIIADPGDGGALPSSGGQVAITTAGAETRSLAAPDRPGLELTLAMTVDNGNAVVTAASAINAAGNTIMTFADAGDVIVLRSIDIGGTNFWRVVANDGVALS